MNVLSPSDRVANSDGANATVQGSRPAAAPARGAVPPDALARYYFASPIFLRSCVASAAGSGK
jgi:hypothetical protein